jgi:hypothetical protein
VESPSETQEKMKVCACGHDELYHPTHYYSSDKRTSCGKSTCNCTRWRPVKDVSSEPVYSDSDNDTISG